MVDGMTQTNAALQGWIALLAAFSTAVLGIFKYFNYRTRADRITTVGQAFNATVEALADKDEIKRNAAAILLRRFFDPGAEQGQAHVPYEREAVAVIAALLRDQLIRDPKSEAFQKLLADGLAYASTLKGTDLQGCILTRAFLGERQHPDDGHRWAGWRRAIWARFRRKDNCGKGRRPARRRRGNRNGVRPPVDLTDADLFGADLSHAHLRGVTARGTVFYRATLHATVFEDADLAKADFRDAGLLGANFKRANLTEARFEGADLIDAKFVGACLTGASFAEAKNVPPEIDALLDDDKRFPNSVTTPLAARPEA
jgi:uncharacterized protein YjbI with pentapeptide repeats